MAKRWLKSYLTLKYKANLPEYYVLLCWFQCLITSGTEPTFISTM